MIPQITEINFPQYATLHKATCSFAEMGDRTISTQVRIDGDVVPTFDGWELQFKGERFVLPILEPQATKDNTTRDSLVDLTFYSWPTLQMKRYFFFNLPSVTAGVAIPDQYIASVNLPITGFVQLFNGVLQYYFGTSIRMELFEQEYDTNPVRVEINYSHIWDVLTRLYDFFGYRWKIVKDGGAYVIKVNFPAEYIEDHDFEYGYDGGLLKFERQVQDSSINNILLGRGGEKNLPYRYFKRYDENAERPDTFPDDPDALYELKNIYFDRLRDINFRWYVRGWMQNPKHDKTWELAYPSYVYPVYTEAQCPESCLFAFRKGKTDDSFQPVEYVKDSVSVERYGERWGAVENKDDVYPTIQGLIRAGIGRVDETVAVSEILTDDIDAAAHNAATENLIEGRKDVYDAIEPNGTKTATFIGEPFVIPSGKIGNLAFTSGDNGDPYFVTSSYTAALRVSGYTLRAKNEGTGEIVSGSGLSAGTYRYVAEITVKNDSDSGRLIWMTYGFNGIKLVIADEDANAWKPTFDIWVKNIWNTQRAQGESDQAYSERVWLPILGDRVGNEAKLVFSTGPMSISQDYEFQLAAYPVPDQSMSINGVPSEWKITLRKSDAEFDATGLFIPNATTGGQPQAGDRFFFIGIDMPTMYVTEAERKLNEIKTTELDKEAEVNPTWAITLDKVRVHTHADGEYGKTLAERLSAGCAVRTTDPRFTPGEVLVLYVQTLTYTWNDGDQVPDIEVVLSDKIVSSSNPIQKLSGDVEYIRDSYVRSSDLEAAIKNVAGPLFLKKTGEKDSSNSPTTFASAISSKNFRQGDIGGAGWGHYEDGEGSSILELDKLVVRKEMRVNSLVANQIAYVGGKQINSAASIECSQVIESENTYTCYFDQRQGTVSNLFVVGDIAMGQSFDPKNVQTRYYRCEVSAVGPDYIVLSKLSKAGDGAPEKGDTIVQYGHVSDKNRQFVIIRDVIGGGNERMLSGLDGVSADGDEYYFAGVESGDLIFTALSESGGANLQDSYGRLLGYNVPSFSPRWFVGNKNGHYAEWKNGTFTVKGNIIVTGGNLEYLTGAITENSGQQGGVILSQFMGVRDANNNIVAGMNGSHTLTGWTKSGYGVLMVAAGIPSNRIDHAAEEATTRIFSDGDLFCSMLHANGGEIGPFSINSGQPGDSNGLYAIDDDTNGISLLKLEPGLLTQSAFPASGGSNYLTVQLGMKKSQASGASLSSAYFKNLRTTDIAGGRKTNLCIDVESRAAGMENTGVKAVASLGVINRGLHVSAFGGTENYAIYCPDGVFAGLRPEIRYLTDSSSSSEKSLSEYDSTIIVSNTSDLTVKLPASPKIGQAYMIYHLGAGRMFISGNGKKIYSIAAHLLEDSSVLTSEGVLWFVYSGDYQPTGATSPAWVLMGAWH